MNLISHIGDVIRATAREQRRQKIGFLHASGFAVGSAKSRTPKRAAQRRRRRAAKLEARNARHNPAGIKNYERCLDRRFGVVNPGAKQVTA